MTDVSLGDTLITEVSLARIYHTLVVACSHKFPVRPDLSRTDVSDGILGFVDTSLKDPLIVSQAWVSVVQLGVLCSLVVGDVGGVAMEIRRTSSPTSSFLVTEAFPHHCTVLNTIGAGVAAISFKGSGS